MTNGTHKYFKDHVPESPFSNQRDLSTTLDGIGCREIIESKLINPLTVRLFSAREGLGKIKKQVEQLTTIPPSPQGYSWQDFYSGPLPQSELYGTSGVSGSLELSRAYPLQRKLFTEDPSFLPKKEPYRFETTGDDTVHLIDDSTGIITLDLHVGIYSFFINLDSALDRVRLELNSIYFDGKKEIDKKITRGNQYWEQYTKPQEGKTKTLEDKGFTGIFSILTGNDATSLTDRTGKYRNRLAHDGDLEIFVEKVSGKVYLPEDPLSKTPIFNIELLPFATTAFDEIQKLLNNVYGQMIADLKNFRKVPLVI